MNDENISDLLDIIEEAAATNLDRLTKGEHQKQSSCLSLTGSFINTGILQKSQHLERSLSQERSRSRQLRE